jgi:hypothetical protein
MCASIAMAKPGAKQPFDPKPPKRRPFYHRFLMALALAAGIIGCSLAIGILGYHFIGGLKWVDALLDAAMILSGMGPVSPLTSDAAKVFAACYALFSGLILISATGIVLSPLFHRVLHRFHVEERDLK